MSKNLNTIFPFYETLAEQNLDKEYVDKDCMLVGERNRLLPFMIRRLIDGTLFANVTFKIYDAADDSVVQTLDAATFLDLGTHDVTYEYLTYNGTLLAANLDTSKIYYIILFDGTVNWYSERFSVRASMSDFMLLTFQFGNPLDNMIPLYDFKLYINQVLKTPEYPRFDDAIEKDGIKVYRSQITQKQNIIRLLSVPEYLVDALMVLPLADTVSLSIQNGDSIAIQQIEIPDPEWINENKGATATVIINLIEYTIIKKLNFTEMGCTGVATTNIRQDTVNLTAGVQATIVFSSVLSAGYTPGGIAQSAGGSAVRLTFADITTSGFKVTSNIDCTYYWTAIKE